MAIKLALLSFEFRSIEGLEYNPTFDHEFGTSDPLPGESIQPVINKAFSRIRACMAKSISSNHKFGQTCIRNVDNYLHIATNVFGTELQHTDNSRGRCNTVLTCKFYRLDPETSYRVSIDIEEMPTTLLDHREPLAYTYGRLSYQNIQCFARGIKKKFDLFELEVMPLVKRGRIDFPRYLLSSDNRLLEYDFDRLVHEEESEFQNIKIVHSPSLGNTLLQDNVQIISEADSKYAHAMLDKGFIDYSNQDLLILGGGSGALLWELLRGDPKKRPKFVTLVEIDKAVLEASKKHMRPFGEVLEEQEGDNHKIIIDDCMKVLRQSLQAKKKYDVIFNDLTDVPVCRREDSLTAFEPSRALQKENPWHFMETILNLSLECLKDEGIYMTHTTGFGNTDSIKAFEDLLNNLKIKVNYEPRTCYIPSFMENWLFYSVTKVKQAAAQDKAR